MSRYRYQSRDNQGRMLTGVLSAGSADEAGQQLRAQGQFIVRIERASDTSASDDDQARLRREARKIKRAEVICFAHQLAVMVETGVPLSEALQCAVEQAGSPSLRLVLEDVTRMVEGGAQLSAALERYPNVFPSLMVSLVRASEASGTMGAMLDRVSKQLAAEARIRRQVRGAMMYPGIMFAVAVTVTTALLVFVLPRFTELYSARGAALPWPTQMLMSTSAVLTGYWWLWLGLGAVVVGVVGLGLQTEGGRRLVDTILLHTPVIRTMFINLYVTRSTAALGTMIGAGVPVLDAVEIVRDVTSSYYFRDVWDRVDDALQQGMQLSDPLLSATLIPKSVTYMIRSGEKSGRLGAVLERIAEYTQAEFDDAVKSVTQLIEPMMVIAMGAIIGFVAISLLLPIFNVGQVVAQ